MTAPAIAPALATHDLRRFYPARQGLFRRPALIRAVDGVSFMLDRGRTLGVVGESGCGKSTLARMVTLLEPADEGRIEIAGRDVATAGGTEWRALRRSVQMVFQNPYGALNPRQTVGRILEEPLAINRVGSRGERRATVMEMLQHVGLRADQYGRYPHMLSGGQRQRVAIALALILRPSIVIADEAVSALDVSIRAQILNLLLDLQERFEPGYLFISHDLSVVKHIADEVMVMYLGRVVERAPRRALFSRPAHPYTQALLAATPGMADRAKDAAASVIRGEPPSPIAPPAGCHYHTRCPYATEQCRVEIPVLRPLGEAVVACHNAETVVPLS